MASPKVLPQPGSTESTIFHVFEKSMLKIQPPKMTEVIIATRHQK